MTRDELREAVAVELASRDVPSAQQSQDEYWHAADVRTLSPLAPRSRLNA